MAKKPGIPAYRQHKQSGLAIVTLRSLTGRRRDYVLGPYQSPESYAEYTRLLTEWQQSHQQLPGETLSADNMTMNQLILAFWKHCQAHYVDEDGSNTTELGCIKGALKHAKALYGDQPAMKFGPLALRSVRERMIDAKLTRQTINKQIGRIRLMFKWAVSVELLKPDVYEALRTVAGLQAGRTKAKDRPPVPPVADEVVNATIPHLSRTIAAMVQVQRLTGARPTEVCRMRVCEFDMAEELWKYQPAKHKNRWRGKKRVVWIGPKAQEILKGFFTANPEDFLFSPERTHAERLANLRAKRQTRVQPSQVCRKKAKPKRQAGERYTKDSYNRAVSRACDRAFPPPTPLKGEELKAWRKAHRWQPNQLRHSFGTDVRKQFGLEGAQVGLGHSNANVTEIYAERDNELGKKIAAQLG